MGRDLIQPNTLQTFTIEECRKYLLEVKKQVEDAVVSASPEQFAAAEIIVGLLIQTIVYLSEYEEYSRNDQGEL